MEPRKFEDQIKHTLENREIQPTSKSWEQLRAKLDKNEKKAIPLKWWLGIAASFIGGVLLVSIFYTSSEIADTPQMVENAIEDQSGQPIFEEPTELVVMPKEELTQKVVAPVISNPIAPKSESISVLATSDETKAQEKIETESLPKEQIVIAEKVEELIATVSTLEENSGNLTDKELDVLLAKATQQILKERELKSSTAQINANSLLQDVEMELDQSFREKIFEMLKDGFNKTRTAIANRND